MISLASPHSGIAASRFRSGDHFVPHLEPLSAWRFAEWNDLHDYNGLLPFRVWRIIRRHYARSAVGASWAIHLPAIARLALAVVICSRRVGVGSNAPRYAALTFLALLGSACLAVPLAEPTASTAMGARLILQK